MIVVASGSSEFSKFRTLAGPTNPSDAISQTLFAPSISTFDECSENSPFWQIKLSWHYLTDLFFTVFILAS